jgi:hypothetical protein
MSLGVRTATPSNTGGKENDSVDGSDGTHSGGKVQSDEAARAVAEANLIAAPSCADEKRGPTGDPAGVPEDTAPKSPSSPTASHGFTDAKNQRADVAAAPQPGELPNVAVPVIVSAGEASGPMSSEPPTPAQTIRYDGLKVLICHGERPKANLLSWQNGARFFGLPGAPSDSALTHSGFCYRPSKTVNAIKNALNMGEITKDQYTNLMAGNFTNVPLPNA